MGKPGGRIARAARQAAPLLALGLLALAVVAGAGRSGQQATALDLHTGTAWFPYQRADAAVMLDGPTATRVATVPTGTAPEVVAQAPDGGAYVAGGGTLRRIAGATLAVDPRARLPFRPGDRVVAAGPAVWTVSQDAALVHERDPLTLDSVGPPASFPGRVTSVAGAPDGTLWAAGGGWVVSYAGGRERTRTHLDGMSHAAVLLAAGRVAIADVAQARAQVLDTRSGHTVGDACLDVSTDATVSGATDAPWLLAVASGGAVLTVSDLASGRCLPPVALDGAGSPGRYGPAVERRRKVYVPDHAATGVLVVEPAAADPVVRRIALPAGLAGRPFELLAHNGQIWFDDPSGDIAGVITDEDEAVAVAVAKETADHRPGPVDGDATPSLACVGPAVVQVGAPAAFSATSALEPSPSAWTWSSAGSPAMGTGAAYTTTWGRVGSDEVTVQAQVAGETPRATCRVEVVDRPVVTTTPPPSLPPVADQPSTGAPTVPPIQPLQPRFSVSPNPAIAGRPVTLADLTEGPHSVVGWVFDGASPGPPRGRGQVPHGDARAPTTSRSPWRTAPAPSPPAAASW